MLQPAPLSWLIRFDTGQRCSTSSVAARSSSRPGSAALHFFKSRSGSLAMFAAMRRASSRRCLDVVGASTASQILLHFRDRARNRGSVMLPLWPQISGLNEFCDHLEGACLVWGQGNVLSLVSITSPGIPATSVPDPARRLC